MNVQDLLTFAAVSITFGYAFLLLLLLCDRLSDELRGIFATSTAPLNQLQEKGIGTNQFSDEKELTHTHTPGGNQEPFTAPASEDPWLAPLELTEPCCCRSAIVIPTPQLLLPPTNDVVEQPDIANTYDTWSIRALKKEAERRHLPKYSYLKKAELIAALTAL